MTLEASMKAEMNNLWPEEPRAAGKRAFSRCKRKRAENVTEAWSLVLWRAYAINKAKGGQGADGFEDEGVGSSGHAKR